MHLMRHNDFPAHTAGEVHGATVGSKQLAAHAVHLDCIRRNDIAGRTVPARDSLHQAPARVLQLKARTVKLVFHKIFCIGMFFRPGKELQGISGLLLASHRHNMARLCKIAAVGTNLVQQRIRRVKGFQFIPECIEFAVGDFALPVVVRCLVTPDKRFQLCNPFRHASPRPS